MQNSIHPRNWPEGKGEKVNTSKTRSKERTAKTISGIEKHLKNHPDDGASKARLARLRTT